MPEVKAGVPSRTGRRARGELATLKHGEERRYDLALRVLDGRQAIAAAERRIRAVGGGAG